MSSIQVRIMLYTSQQRCCRLKQTHSNQCRNDGVNGPGDELEAVDVVLLCEVVADKRKY